MMDRNRSWIGVDFGARLRPSTAITFCCKESLQTLLCPKKTDVDLWLDEYVQKQMIEAVFIDAPLSLPKVYFDATDEQSTYHFRKVDRELGAMSPLFLGGLTARAIALKNRWEKEKIRVYETYPAAILQKRFPGKTVEEALLMISAETGYKIPDFKMINTHQKDSILAWYAGYQYLQNASLVFGRVDEGRIFL